MYKHPTQTPSWPAAQAAKTTRNTVMTNPNATVQQKKNAQDAYVKAMRKCLKETGLV